MEEKKKASGNLPQPLVMKEIQLRGREVQPRLPE